MEGLLILCRSQGISSHGIDLNALEYILASGPEGASSSSQHWNPSGFETRMLEENWIITLPPDALAPWITKPLAAIVLII